jgi:hypothetical protein
MFGYLGGNVESSKSGDAQLEKISEKFDILGEQIDELKTEDVTSTEVSEIDDKYKVLAGEFMKSLPVEAQSLRVAKEQKKLSNIAASVEYKEQLNEIRILSKNIINAYKSSGAVIDFKDATPPQNVFSNQAFELKIITSEAEYWSIHLVDRTPDQIGIMFVRMITDAKGNRLTNDSIVFRWLSNDRFGFSLNSNISSEVKSQVTDNLNIKISPMSEAHVALENLIKDIVQYSVAVEYSKKA